MTTPNIEELIADLKMYAGDNGYGHIDYADTMCNAADALQSQAEQINALEREIERLTESLRYEVDCVAAIGAERDDLRVQLDALQVDDELPELGRHNHPEPRTMMWSDVEMSAIKAYARQAQSMVRAKMNRALVQLKKWQNNGGTKAGYEFVDAAITELGRDITGEPK